MGRYAGRSACLHREGGSAGAQQLTHAAAEERGALYGVCGVPEKGRLWNLLQLQVSSFIYCLEITFKDNVCVLCVCVCACVRVRVRVRVCVYAGPVCDRDKTKFGGPGIRKQACM